ncbi:PH domain-containing protein (plasmid) [Streptomyces sp. BHT-5-2]|uniref:PH domain-containing protein n=1 Tax=Streptomyces sp. BHT-5-2 TaxID=2866715 RepID=UPI001C8DD70F|nr:PH domain-containing protein [Streptomyces sp. BHT-5-2]QZL09102.1 PH domain-containing protein [Streptomyces sp. BHT-5-2]
MSTPWNTPGEGGSTPPPASHPEHPQSIQYTERIQRTQRTQRTEGHPPSVGEPDWRRLSPRTLLVHCGWLGAPLGSLALTALATGGRITGGAWLTLAAIAAAFAVVTGAGLVRWARTGFRVTGESLEVRSGLLTRRMRSVPLHRIRTVDLTASPLHRLLGVTVLRAGTAGSGESGGELSLEALATAEGERLRAELLARAATGTVDEDPVLARINWRWLRYAPLTFWVVGGVFVAGGSAYRVLHEIGIEPWKLGFVRRAFEEFGNGMLWLTIPAALLAVVLLGSVGAVVLYVENWWDYRLEWADAGTLRVHRGLLTTRSVTIERARLRGVVLREPLLLRAGGGATVRAVAGGLGNKEENRKRSGLLPPAPRRDALQVASGTLQSPFPTREMTGRQESGSLVRHPRVALRRRRVRGALFGVLPGAVLLAGLGAAFTAPVLLHAAWIYAAVTTPVALWLARDAYRNLGHGIAGRHLVARSGTFSRDTLVLRREAVAAWTFTTSPFTRRAGLVSLTAAVAAGEEGYRIPDLAEGAAPGFAAAATPGLLDEFLVHPQSTRGGTTYQRRKGDSAPEGRFGTGDMT